MINVIFCLSWVLFSHLATIVVGCDFRKENNLAKNISDLHLQLFSSMQKRMKLMKSAVFETQCRGTGCTFNGFDSVGKVTYNEHLFEELKAIRKEIGNMGKHKPRTKACKNGWRKFRNHCYTFFPQKLNWFEAHMFCKQHGSALVQIGDGTENKWISTHYKTNSIWIDATDIAREGHWRSFSNGKAIYTNWSKSNPDNFKSIQHCAAINWGGQGQWDDEYCYKSLPFICELSETEC